MDDMTALENAELRRLVLRVLAQRSRTPSDPEALAAAAQGAYDDLARVSAPLIGQGGVNALTDRALHIARREYPWLVVTREEARTEEPISQALICLKRQEPAVATEAANAVFATFTGLLATFIGEPLTMRLLRKAWPDALSDASSEEPKA